MARFAANLSMMFTELPFIERFGAAARAGFRAVEYLFPYGYDPAEIRAALDAEGLEQALFNTPPGDWEAGERGFAAVNTTDFPRHLQTALDYADVIRPKNIHVMSGLAEGAEARETLIFNLKAACAVMPEQGFVIEPINSRDIPGYFLSRSDQAAAIIAEVDAPNLRLQLDLYHCQIMEGDLTKRIEALAPIIGHVQIAGVPDRHEPDSGETNLPHLISVLERVGYDGYIGCEYRPAGRTEEGLGWFAAFAEQEKKA